IGYGGYLKLASEWPGFIEQIRKVVDEFRQIHENMQGTKAYTAPFNIKIRRKGGYEAVVYFGDEVETALLDYLEERDRIIPVEGHEDALFLSLQNRRITVRAVENLVKKYASRVTTLKKITPHKLRSTYGTSLYQETGDIYLVADVLGHKDVNTTRKHYAAQQDERRRRAAQYVKLREKPQQDS
ncbi:MAG: tyrosine-type recombinase/integrase, partial [Lachnospiraceae bacterium]|nr:tyrosine-type recombinase/integrase [Lachnospiraceae bacterium]